MKTIGTAEYTTGENKASTDGYCSVYMYDLSSLVNVYTGKKDKTYWSGKVLEPHLRLRGCFS